MIYEKHHYKNNFMSAAGSSDKDSMKDIALNRLVDGVIADKKYFVDKLNKIGITTSAGESQKVVLKRTIENLDKIAPKKAMSNADGVSLDPYGLSGIGSILSGGASLWDAISNPNKGLDIEKEKTKQLQAQAAALLAAKQNKFVMPVWGWVAIGAVALTTITIVIIKVSKK